MKVEVDTMPRLTRSVKGSGAVFVWRVWVRSDRRGVRAVIQCYGVSVVERGGVKGVTWYGAVRKGRR